MSRLTVVAGEMVMTTVRKNKFSQLNNKRCYFPNGVISLPFHHLAPAEIDEFKRKKGRRIKTYFWTEIEHFLYLERKALKIHPRRYLHEQILMSTPKIFDKSQKDHFEPQIKNYLKETEKR